jgi:chitinase
MRWKSTLIGALAWHAAAGLAEVVDQAEVSAAVSAYLAAHPIATRIATQNVNATSLMDAVLAGNFTSRLSNATRSRCPVSCSDSGLDSSAWSVYHSLDRLALCDSPMLLDFNLFNMLDDPATHVGIAACTADLESSSSLSRRDTSGDSSCLADSATPSNVTSSVELASYGKASSSTAATDVVNALEQLQAAVALSGSDCHEVIRTVYSGKAAVGVYVGSGLSSQGVASSVLDQLVSEIDSAGSIAQETLVQVCGNDTSRYSLGIFASTTGDLPSVQQALQTWRNNSCVNWLEDSTPVWQTISFLAPNTTTSSTNSSSIHATSSSLASSSIVRSSLLPSSSHALAARGHGSNGGSYRHSHLHHGVGSHLQARDTSADCTTIQVAYGDTCTSLAAECGISGTDFDDYNPTTDLCSTLAVGQHVCCTSGTLPDYTPSESADGDCYSYTVQTNDTCSELAAAYDITVDEIEAWNTGSNGTWGWMGCSDLLIGSYMCLSAGNPPMPANVPNAVCGPQVNDTATAPAGTDLSTLNECPLNACCDIWGQCGITADFCTESSSTTGNPGTAASGLNGCISNCGTDIVYSDEAPAETYSIAYFEASDQSRPCLTMSVNDVNTTFYTHIHFAFATITSDWTLNITGMEDQITLLSNMTGVKRILSIGGWDFSTDPSTYMIFREAVTADNRGTLINNIVSFLEEWELDGVDIDWEYPDEPDIPGIPAGTTADSTNYYLFLALLKTALPSGMTLSLTAPASYWYLSLFPIEAISSTVDYIVYMTYDLHGQWDYGRAYSDSGCSAGDCLRSHVNLTETISALSMITKAGVSSNKVAVGVSSYGRSFEMTEAGCWTDMCTYTGPDSGALPGPCTDTAGYLANYEIELILADNPTAALYWDDDSYSNILVYNDTQFAAYMNDTNKAVRTALYKEFYFLGTSDWAVDLQSEDGNEDTGGSGVIYISPSIFDEPSPTVAGYPPFTMVWPTSSLVTPMVVQFPPYPYIVYDGPYPITSWVPVPSTTVSAVSFEQWDGPSQGIPSTTFNLVSSFSPAPVTIVVSGGDPTVLYPPPISTPYTPQVVVVNSTSYTAISGVITGPGTDLVTGIPTPTTTTTTVTQTDSGNNTVVVVILPTPSTTSTPEYTLPSTTSSSGTITYTWSEQQIDSLAKIDSTTSVTTTTADDGKTTTLVFPVNTGGFYWDPVSLPDVPLPTAGPPDLPPIPDFPCFTLFDIFTIDCPPNQDKKHKTTHYTSGKPTSTCTTSCGSLCTFNCDVSSTSTSTTSSDECSSGTATVTDYWVSCAGTACSTISSATATGCGVTATTTTTGLYCTTRFDIWSTDDQGENGVESYTATTSTLPEEVAAGGTTYVVGPNGEVTLGGGEVVTVPTVTAGTTVVTLGGEVLTVDPAVATVITVVVVPVEASTSSTITSTETIPSTSSTITSTETIPSTTSTSTSSAKDTSTTSSTEKTTSTTSTSTAPPAVSTQCVGGTLTECTADLEKKCFSECITWPLDDRGDCTSACITDAIGLCNEYCPIL